MKFALKIVHKGFLIVLAPVVLEICFFAYLFELEQKLERQTQEEARSKQILYQANELYIDLAKTITTTAGNKLPQLKGEVDPEDMQRLRTNIKERFAILYKIVPENSPQRVELDKMNAAAKRLSKMIPEIDKSLDVRDASGIASGISELMDDLSFIRKIKPIGDQLSKAIRKFKEPELAVSERIVLEQEETRRQLKFTSLVAIAANVVLAAILAIFFSRNITGRISTLVDNSRRLAELKPLAPLMKGNDEIAELDGSLHETAVRLEQAEQLKKDFYSMITHDLRSPLTSIFGSLCLAQEGVYGEPPAPLKAKMIVMERNLQRLLSLINDLLDIEKLRAGKMPLQLALQNTQEIMDRTRETVEDSALAKKIKIETQCQPLEFYADGERIAQVIVNLVANAIKFSPDDSTITIACRNTGVDVEFSVRDQGRGIPEDALQSIFERFGQVAAADSEIGTGLGLAICKMIVDAHKGTIGVETSQGKGSRFYFCLPLF